MEKVIEFYISRISVRKVVDIVLPNITSSMYYKVGIVNNGEDVTSKRCKSLKR